jgi:hypothetical protein
MLVHGSLDELRRRIDEEGRHETLEEAFFRLTETDSTPTNGVISTPKSGARAEA